MRRNKWFGAIRADKKVGRMSDKVGSHKNNCCQVAVAFRPLSRDTRETLENTVGNVRDSADMHRHGAGADSRTLDRQIASNVDEGEACKLHLCGHVCRVGSHARRHITRSRSRKWPVLEDATTKRGVGVSKRRDHES